VTHTLQHTATHTAIHTNTLQHTAHIAIRCNALQQEMEEGRAEMEALMRDVMADPTAYWAERSALTWN